MSSPVNVGDILGGKYQVERVLGVGGMGIVVAAKHLTLGERVAIKFLLPQALERDDVVKRFIQEGRAANRLRGEHIGRVHDVGRLQTGAPFLVMEYLDGQDLGAILRQQGPLSIEVSIDYVIQACEALAEAHSMGIVHRDIKPSNLFVIQRLDGTPSIKLIDFGISKFQLPGAEGAEGEMTATAVMMGSPLYMAPEQMASARDVDESADIWSLGVILHSMLTGAPPFRAPSVMQVYELITLGAPPIRKIRPDVPEGIEAAILRCLQKDRRLRFANVAELAEALAGFGPPETRFNAARIKRILSSRSTRDSLPISVSDVQVPVALVTPAGVEAPSPPSLVAPDPWARAEPKPDSKRPHERTMDLGATPPPPSASSAAIDPLGTHGPWDQKTPPPFRHRRPAALIAAALIVLAGAAVAILAVPIRTPTPPVDSSGTLLTTALAASGQPAVLPGTAAPAPAPPQPAPTPHATTSSPPVTMGETPKPPAQPVTTPAQPVTIGEPPKPAPSATSGRSHHAVPPPARPPARTKSADDLFVTPQ